MIFLVITIFNIWILGASTPGQPATTPAGQPPSGPAAPGQAPGQPPAGYPPGMSCEF